MAILSGAGVSLTSGPQVPTSSNPFVQVILQAQDGSFIGTTADDSGTSYVFSFDTTGKVRWIVPNADNPRIATAGGGVIARAPPGFNLTLATRTQDGLMTS